MSTEVQQRFTQAEQAIFFAWLVERPNIVKSKQNAQVFGDWLQANGLKATLGNLDKAFAAIKSQLEIVRTPQEIEESKIEAIRTEILRQVYERLAPARIDLRNPLNATLLSKWLYANRNGRMSVAYVEDFLKACRFEVEWLTPPANLERLRKQEERGFVDSRDTDAQNRRHNYALPNDAEKAAKAKAAADKKKLEEQEARVMGEAVEREIAGYLAVVNGRVNRPLTDSIQSLLRQWNQKRGNVLQAIREMPDEPSAAESWLLRRL